MKLSLCLIALTLFSTLAAGAAEPETWLWQIGKEDRNAAEFALAPRGYGEFQADGFYIVGVSDPAKAWPYVHPGPTDAWAGGKAHTFTIVFGIDALPEKGNGKFVAALVDTHAGRPPVLTVRINGKAFKVKLPAGGADASVMGNPAAGKPHRMEIAFPMNLLQKGANFIQIENAEGSWIVYDALALSAPGATAAKVADYTAVIGPPAGVRAIVERDGKSFQPVRLNLLHSGAAREIAVRAGDVDCGKYRIAEGSQSVEVLVPAVTEKTSVPFAIDGLTQPYSASVELNPVRRMTIYLVPHSHTDIGYTEAQPKIEEKQVNNLLQGIAIAKKTANYPAGSRFVWNVEVLWAADLYLNRLNDTQRQEFLDAVKNGQVGLNGMYLNELTGLCRPEELLRLFRFAKVLEERCGVKIDSAMISDVPGYTWGTVPAMAQAGIRYFSTAPNFFDRIGDILVHWTNKPFWWVSPSGNQRVLVWIPTKGYALSHLIHHLSDKYVNDYQAELDREQYPYDIAHLRWSGHGDNAVPEPSICDFARDWNARYAWPKFVISTTSEAFAALEKKYGDKLPEVRGDWTPYWEDGAGSSAAETGMNRASADRLSQAETLFALRGRGIYPAGEFEQAWNKVLLYSEHTWGAWCSVSDPENPMTREQWAIKQSYALEADRLSRELLGKSLATNGAAAASSIDVYNTCSWSRTELVLVPRELSAAGDRVADAQGRPVPSQRLKSGELAILAQEIPPFAASRFTISAGTANPPAAAARAEENSLDNGLLQVKIDPATGAVADLRAGGIEGNFVDASSGHAVNDYLYLPGDKLADLKRNGPVRISTLESGPLVATLRIESEAPGCNSLVREVRVVAGLDRVDLTNIVDKKRAATGKPGDGGFAQRGGKESVNFAFPFAVKDGVMRLDLPFAVIVPWQDLMPSACKNWFTVSRWADVSGEGRGITWVTMDAPLVQVGGITATLLGSQNNPDVWRKAVEPAQTLYSWAMNNHWGTNYRAYQDGIIVFRYALRPHGAYDPIAAAQLGAGLSQPLLAAPARGEAPATAPLLKVEPADVIVTALKPSDDGKAWIVRLYGASGQNREAKLTWGTKAPVSMHQSDLSEMPLKKIDGAIPVAAWDVVTVRVE